MISANVYLLADVVITVLCKYTSSVKPAQVALTCVQDHFHMMQTEMGVYKPWWPTVVCVCWCVKLCFVLTWACTGFHMLYNFVVCWNTEGKAFALPKSSWGCVSPSHSFCLSASLSVPPLISWLGRSLLWHMCLDHVRQQWNYVGRGSSCLWKQPWRPDERLRERTHSSWPSGSQAALHRPNGLASLLFR